MQTDLRPKLDLANELLRLGYTLLCRLGQGATSEVFEARSVANGQRIALKVSRQDIGEAPAVVARMQTEWNVGRGLRHPHLVQIFDGGILPDGRAWMAMERLVGRDLFVIMKQEGQVQPLRGVRIIRQVCEALRVLHQRGAVHRDVKPENIYLCDRERFVDHVKLIDFGVLALPDGDPQRLHAATGCKIVGTPLYLAPEQACGESPDPRTDLYALGAVMYHMLSGRPPFSGRGVADLIARHVTQPVEPIDNVIKGLPRALVTLIHRCLEKQRDMRPAGVAEVISDLDRCTAALEYEARPTPSRAVTRAPPLPKPGEPTEWIRFAQRLQRAVFDYWSGMSLPRTVERSVARLGETEQVLARSIREAETRREAADQSARRRIERRAKLQRRARELTARIEKISRELHGAAAAVDTFAEELDSVDERYEGLVAKMHAVIEAPIANRAASNDRLEHLDRLRIEMDELLEHRAAGAGRLANGRLRERRGAQKLAAARAEETELQRAFSDLELDERKDGFRTEQLACHAADETQSACRAFEQACICVLVDHMSRADRIRSSRGP